LSNGRFAFIIQYHIPGENSEEWKIAAELRDYVSSLREQGEIVSDTFGKLKEPSQYHGIQWVERRGEFVSSLRWADAKLAFSICGSNQHKIANQLREEIERLSSGDRKLEEASLKAGKKRVRMRMMYGIAAMI